MLHLASNHVLSLLLLHKIRKYMLHVRRRLKGLFCCCRLKMVLFRTRCSWMRSRSMSAVRCTSLGTFPEGERSASKLSWSLCMLTGYAARSFLQAPITVSRASFSQAWPSALKKGPCTVENHLVILLDVRCQVA